MKHSLRTTGKAIFAVAAIIQIAIAVAIIAFIWWMFAHGFHDLGQFILKLAATSQA